MNQREQLRRLRRLVATADAALVELGDAQRRYPSACCWSPREREAWRPDRQPGSDIHTAGAVDDHA